MDILISSNLERLLYLVSGCDYKLVNDLKQDLHRILIVTYTEKAAGELKSRIREKLNRDDVDIAPIGTIHSFCQSVIKQYGLTANLPLKLTVIDDSALNKFAEIYELCEVVRTENKKVKQYGF